MSGLDSTDLELDLACGAIHGACSWLDDLRLPIDAYSSRQAGLILEACRALKERGEQLNLSSVREQLRDTDKLDEVGEDALVAVSVRDAFASSKAVAKLHELAEVRRVRDGLRKALARCASGHLEAVRAELDELDLTGDQYRQDSAVRLSDASKVALLEAAQHNRNPQRNPRIDLGLDSLTNSIGGLEAGNLMVVGADTGVGKSSLVLAMAMGQAPRNAVGIVTCEDAVSVWGQRYQARQTGISSLRLRHPLSLQEVEKLEATAQQMRDANIWLDEQIGKGEDDVLAAMRRLVRKHGCRIVYVDYVQTIIARDSRQPRKDQVRELAARIKGQAASLGVPVVLLSQLSRPPKGAEKREPNKHDLKETGDIENSAEVIVLLWEHEVAGRLCAKVDKCKWGARDGLLLLERRPDGTLQDLERELRMDQGDFYG